MKLRHYQVEAVNSIYGALEERDDNALAVIPTGGGKTAIIAQIIHDVVGRWDGRVLVLAHVKELLQQAEDALEAICPDVEVGVYSAGLKRRDTEQSCILAGIQSVYRRAADLGPFALVLVDECHRIPPDGEGMYRTFLDEARIVSPRLRVVGLTATPYRMSTGEIAGPENVLNHVCYEIGVRDLVDRGFLSPLVSQPAEAQVDTSGVTRRGGEFVASELAAVMDVDHKVEAACREILASAEGRQAGLVFCSGVNHAMNVGRTLHELSGEPVPVVVGDTPAADRADIIERFKSGRIRWLVNCNVLTEGFDAPRVDLVALLRPTLSPGLYYQMVGRGFRVSPGKENCLVLDFGGNVQRHGPVDQVRVFPRSGSGSHHKEAVVGSCPGCGAPLPMGVLACAECYSVNSERDEPKHDTQAATLPVLSEGASEFRDETYEVKGIAYHVHRKRGAEDWAPKTLRVEYRVGVGHVLKEWVCVEHDGFAGKKARDWWSKRSNARFPFSARNAVALANNQALCETHEITVRQFADRKKFDQITKYRLGPVPAWEEPVDEPKAHPFDDHFSDEEVPL